MTTSTTDTVTELMETRMTGEKGNVKLLSIVNKNDEDRENDKDNIIYYCTIKQNR